MEMGKGPNVPVIETERLRLRGHRPEDLPNCARMWADPAVTRYIGERALSEEEVWARILRYAGHWLWLDFGYWLVEEKGAGQFVGEVGFADHKRDIDLPIKGVPEIGWALAPPMSGKGYATESVRAAIRWFGNRFGSILTVCLIAPENVASIRVANKCGYDQLHHTTYRGAPAMLFTQAGLENGLHFDPPKTF